MCLPRCWLPPYGRQTSNEEDTKFQKYFPAPPSTHPPAGGAVPRKVLRGLKWQPPAGQHPLRRVVGQFVLRFAPPPVSAAGAGYVRALRLPASKAAPSAGVANYAVPAAAGRFVHTRYARS